MIAFLQSPAGRWALRVLAVLIAGAIVHFGLGVLWHGNGHAVLIGLFAVMTASIAYGIGLLPGIFFPYAIRRSQKPVRFTGTIPPLSTAKQAKVRRLHKVMAEAGVFAPEVPDPALAFPGFAIDKQPIDWLTVLTNLVEAGYYFPDCDLGNWRANLWFGALPGDHHNPPAGRTLAALSEDETIIFSFVYTHTLTTLASSGAGGEEWEAVDESALADFAAAGMIAS